MCLTRRRPAMCTNCRPSTISRTRSSWNAWPTGSSTGLGPRRNPRRAPDAVAIEIVDSTNITFANFKAYRVTRSHAPYPSAVRIYNSSNIRFRNVRVNSEHGYATCDDSGCGTFLRAGKFPYNNAIQDLTRRVEVRERDFAVFDIAGEPSRPAAASPPVVLAPGATVERLEGGFGAIAGAAVDAAGTLYFVDHGQHRIHSWSRERGLSIVGDAPSDPVNLAMARNRVTCSSSRRPDARARSTRWRRARHQTPSRSSSPVRWRRRPMRCLCSL